MFFFYAERPSWLSCPQEVHYRVIPIDVGNWLAFVRPDLYELGAQILCTLGEECVFTRVSTHLRRLSPASWSYENPCILEETVGYEHAPRDRCIGDVFFYEGMIERLHVLRIPPDMEGTFIAARINIAESLESRIRLIGPLVERLPSIGVKPEEYLRIARKGVGIGEFRNPSKLRKFKAINRLRREMGLQPLNWVLPNPRYPEDRHLVPISPHLALQQLSGVVGS